MNTADDDKDLKVKALIIKNSILTIVGTISTTVCWIGFLSSQNGTGGNGIFIHLDLYINCIVIALMFKYNEKYYKRVCKCCIIICLRDCDKSYDKTDKKKHNERQQYVEDYLHNIDLSTLFEFGSSINANTNKMRMDSKSRSDIVDNNDEYEPHIKLSDIIGDIDMKDIGIANDYPITPPLVPIENENKATHPQHLSMADIVTNTTINCK